MAIRVTLKDDLVGEEIQTRLGALGLELVYNDEEVSLINPEEENKKDMKSSKKIINKKKNKNN